MELRRVHSERNARAGQNMRTWEIIVEEKRLASYDIMANPQHVAGVGLRQ